MYIAYYFLKLKFENASIIRNMLMCTIFIIVVMEIHELQHENMKQALPIKITITVVNVHRWYIKSTVSGQAKRVRRSSGYGAKESNDELTKGALNE